MSTWGRALLVMVTVLAAAGCATVPTGPLAPGEVRLLSLEVPEDVRAGVPYEVVLRFEAAGQPLIPRACFFWSGEGPFCVAGLGVTYGSPGMLRARLSTRTPRFYTLTAYVEYSHGADTRRSNQVSAGLFVR
jgi:hypothetical protein